MKIAFHAVYYENLPTPLARFCCEPTFATKFDAGKPTETTVAVREILHSVDRQMRIFLISQQINDLEPNPDFTGSAYCG